MDKSIDSTFNEDSTDAHLRKLMDQIEEKEKHGMFYLRLFVYFHKESLIIHA